MNDEEIRFCVSFPHTLPLRASVQAGVTSHVQVRTLLRALQRLPTRERDGDLGIPAGFHWSPTLKRRVDARAGSAPQTASATTWKKTKQQRACQIKPQEGAIAFIKNTSERLSTSYKVSNSSLD